MGIEVLAQSRKLQGTSASRRLRHTGKVPGILYGGRTDPVTIELEHNALFHQLRNEKFHASVLDLSLDGKKEQVLLRTVNMHPWKPQVQHIDFQRVLADQKIHMKVPLHFTNAEISPAVKLSAAIISHVLNELDEAGGRVLRQVIDRAHAVLWVEPGTFADSRALITLRETLRERFHVIAPCTHHAGCGLLAPENARHWCHHFAAPPAGIMADSNWVRFAQRAGIDLRSLPYSFLVLERKGLREPVPGILPDDWSRVLGEARVYKGFSKLLSCQHDGVRELELQKRVSPELHRAFKNGNAPSLWRWTGEGGRITDAQPHASSAKPAPECR